MDKTMWLPADWDLPSALLAGTTLRGGGVSQGPYSRFNLGLHVADDPQAVAQNRQTLTRSLQLPSALPWLEQVHSNEVLYHPPAGEHHRADAAWTDQADSPLVVMTADCLPVVFYHQHTRHIGVAHAGWRGLAAGILENTVSAMGGASHAWMGPAISQAHFEVGDEVRQAFVDNHAADRVCFYESVNVGRWMADLYQLARHRLQLAGVTSISGGGLCTVSDDKRFYSYRRDGGKTGRMATVICRLS